MRDDQLQSRHDTIEFISNMVESGVVERWEVSDQVREALEWLKEATARVVTDKDHRYTELDPATRQRRRGRGSPTDVIAGEVEPASPQGLPESAETVTDQQPDQ